MVAQRIEALRRLLREGGSGGQAKLDAISALAHHTVWVAKHGGGAYRLLTNRDGLRALPVFTTREAMEEAAFRLGWIEPDGRLGLHEEIGARAAFRYVLEAKIDALLIDFGSEHALDIFREDLDEFLKPYQKSSTGSWAVLPSVTRERRKSSFEQLEIVQAAAQEREATGVASPVVSNPHGIGGERGEPLAQGQALQEAPSQVSGGTASGHHGEKQAIPSQPIVGRVAAPTLQPEDAIFECLRGIFRNYPEVEWACWGTWQGQVAVGLRVDERMRARIGELAAKIHEAVQAHTVLLDEPAAFRAAKAEAIVFYPWRR
ncbi:MAG: SseB family protein [Sandaracinaceae bacterium]|nr:SseB family protein [Sandaracinaceae bacterium]